MKPGDVFKGLARQKHAISLEDGDNSAEVENVETLMAHIMYGDKNGDLELAPGDTIDFDPYQIVKAVQDGEAW